MNFNMAPFQKKNVINEIVDLTDDDISYSRDVNRCLIQNNMENEDSMEDKTMDEIEKMYDECMYACYMCNLSFNSQLVFEEHFWTHNDDSIFHHSNIDNITEFLPQSSIKLLQSINCEFQDIGNIQLSYDEPMINHTGEKLQHGRVCDGKFYHKGNTQTDLKSDKNERKLTCSRCGIVIVGITNYYMHFKDAHNKKSIHNPRPNQSSSKDSDEENKTKILNTKKFVGPPFWKNARTKAGLSVKKVLPMQFQGQLKLIQCKSCTKLFARSPTPNEGNTLPTKPPCNRCFKIQKKSALNQHQAEKHRELPPYICKECLMESDTWYNYVQHMKMHLRYAKECSECVHKDMINKPPDAIFLCVICEMSFDSKDELKAHILIHFKN